MLYQTQAEINSFYSQVIQKVASSSKLQVPDWDIKSTAELPPEISVSSPNVHTLLNQFLKAYQHWYDVHAQIDAAGTAGQLTVQQNDDLMRAIEARDKTRSDLLNAL